MNFWLRKIQLFILSSIFILGFSSFVKAQITEESISPNQNEVTEEGVRITLSIDHVDYQKTPGLFRAGDDVRFRFSMTDVLTKKVISGAYPAAWVDPISEIYNCVQKVSSFLSGNKFSQAELDLNVFYVLTLNADPSIAVVDPLFGFGGTQLLALIKLKSRGVDWEFSENQNFIFVSMPESNQIAVISTLNWKVVNNINVQTSPRKLSLQPDGQYLWVVCQGDKSNGVSSNLAVIDVASLKLKKHIPIGDGDHDLLVKEDSRFVYVTNKADNNLMVVDAQTMKLVTTIPTCTLPSSIDISSKANTIYVISEDTGEVTVVDAEKYNLSNSIQLESGICQISFEPTGRYALIINSKKDNISIIDAFTNKIAQVGNTESQPDQISFSEDLAYVRHRNSKTVLMIPLNQIGSENQTLPIVDFPGGQNPPGKMSKPSLATGIVQAPGTNAMLIANPLDKTVYYYREGMAAPMGNFSNYDREPIAVMAIDRSLREVSPGNYETVAKLRSSGMHDIAFFVDAPRFINCFRINILPDLED